MSDEQGNVVHQDVVMEADEVDAAASNIAEQS